MFLLLQVKESVQRNGIIKKKVVKFIDIFKNSYTENLGAS